jgi:RNA polymerase sigma-70 factor, ECF subfamily
MLCTTERETYYGPPYCETSNALRAFYHERMTNAPPPPDLKRESFEREALVHLDVLYRVALRLSGNPSDADDLVQETMLKAYRAWDQYEKGTNAKAWLLTILRHAFINEYRRRTRHPETVDLDKIEPYAVFPEVQDEDPQGAFFDRIVDDQVLRAIDQLPVVFRETLVLSDVEGMSYQEIAGILEIPVGTVKSRLFRARQLLQGKLYDYAVEMGYIKGSPA